ncbi:MAG: MoxR family ATPase [Pseudomonadota bacterium]
MGMAIDHKAKNSAGALDTPTSVDTEGDVVARAEAAIERIAAARREIGHVIYGQEAVIEHALVAILSGGHALLVGLPGLAKTLLVDTLGTVLGLDDKRVQFTPDLLPADILGSEILEEDENGKRHFRFLKGPVFCQLLMADEINRASPRTQSALLQAMQEKQVTIAGKRYELPHPFHVLATQNPIEQEGTYPLPEAQLDRFLLQIDITYPTLEAERAMLVATTTGKKATASQAISAQELENIQSLVRAMPVGEQVVDGILSLVRSARPSAAGSKGLGVAQAGGDVSAEEGRKDLIWGPGPRAAQALMLGVRARALIDGRFAPSLDDVAALAPAALKHRMAMSFHARAEGQTIEAIIAELVAKL